MISGYYIWYFIFFFSWGYGDVIDFLFREKYIFDSKVVLGFFFGVKNYVIIC